MLKWNLSFDSSSNEKDEDVSEKLDLSRLKVDEVPQKNFWDNPSPPILLTLGVPGLENHHESKFETNYSSSPPLENLHKESRGKKRKREEDFMSKFDGNGSGTTSRRKENDLQQYSKASSVEMHKMSERRRRDRIAKKVKMLEELIPNCVKSGRASILDQAIQYIQALQHQVQVMSGISAWHSTSTLLARRNQIMHGTLQLPTRPMIAVGYYFGFEKSINYINMLSSNLFPMMSTGSHFPFLPLAVVNNSQGSSCFSTSCNGFWCNRKHHFNSVSPSEKPA